jgi:hypothetical protein
MGKINISIKMRVTNMSFSGKIPLAAKLSREDIERLIKRGHLGWMLVNEEQSPILSAEVPKPDGSLNKRGEPKKGYVSVWNSGAINIIGVTSENEAETIYSMVMEDIKRLVRNKIREDLINGPC